MKKPFIQLCADVTREHVILIAKWLKDETVNRYLSDRPSQSADLDGLLSRISLPNLSHLLSQDGRFWMILDHSQRPVGFIRLIRDGSETELVIVIGDRPSWGRHYARQAIQKCLRIAFFETRTERVTARIRRENDRSVRVFHSLGFQMDHTTPDLIHMTLTLDQYLHLIHEQPARGMEILITRYDRERLMRLLDQSTNMAVLDTVQTGSLLAEEIDRAILLDSRELPENVITMNSQATLSVNEKNLAISLAFPHEVDPSRNRVSVLSPIGTAILGFRAGDQFNWRFPAGLVNIQVRKLAYQPEAAGDYHL